MHSLNKFTILTFCILVYIQSCWAMISPDSPQGQCLLEYGGNLSTGRFPRCRPCKCTKKGQLKCTNQKISCHFDKPAPSSATASTSGSSGTVSADSPQGQCLLEYGGDLSTGRFPRCRPCKCTDEGQLKCTNQKISCHFDKPAPSSATASTSESSGTVLADSPKGQCLLEYGGDLSTGRFPTCRPCKCTDEGELKCTNQMMLCQLAKPAPSSATASTSESSGTVLADSPKGQCLLEYGGDLSTGTFPTCRPCKCTDEGELKCSTVRMACKLAKPAWPVLS